MADINITMRQKIRVGYDTLYPATKMEQIIDAPQGIVNIPEKSKNDFIQYNGNEWESRPYAFSEDGYFINTQEVFTTQTTISENSRKLGDIDGDGSVDTSDCLEVQRYILDEIEFTTIQKIAADVDINAQIDDTDANLILKIQMRTYTPPYTYVTYASVPTLKKPFPIVSITGVTYELAQMFEDGVLAIYSNQVISAGTPIEVNYKGVKIEPLPSQAGQSGKYLKTDGTSASWDTVEALPSQSGQSGKLLTTNGTAASWTDTLPSHNQAASTVSAGIFAGEVKANSSGETYSTYCLRNQRLASTDTNPTVNGEICWTYS